MALEYIVWRSRWAATGGGPSQAVAVEVAGGPACVCSLLPYAPQAVNGPEAKAEAMEDEESEEEEEEEVS